MTLANAFYVGKWALMSNKLISELHWYVRFCVKEDVHTAIRDGMDLDEIPPLTEYIREHAMMEKGWTCRFAPVSPELLECACRTRPMCDCAFKGAICTRRLW